MEAWRNTLMWNQTFSRLRTQTDLLAKAENKEQAVAALKAIKTGVELTLTHLENQS